MTRIDKNLKEATKIIPYRLQFIDSTRFMACMLPILLKEFIRLNVKTNIMIKNANLAELNTKTVSAFLNTQTLEIF